MVAAAIRFFVPTLASWRLCVRFFSSLFGLRIASRDAKFKTWNPSNKRFTALTYTQKCAFGDAVLCDNMIAVVAKFLSRLQPRKLPHDAVPFNDQLATMRIRYNPFSPTNRHVFERIITNCNKVHKRIRTIRGRFQRRHIDYLIYSDSYLGQFAEQIAHGQFPSPLRELFHGTTACSH